MDAESLARACAGGVAVRAQAGEELVVDAGLIRDLCRGDSQDVDPRGLMIEDARITGGLGLSGMEIAFPLRFTRCVFDEPIDVDGAELHRLTLDGCTVPGLLGNGVRIRRDLDLSRSRITADLWTPASTSRSAAVWLCESEIGGRLLCLDTVIESSGRAMQADRMKVGGTIRLLHNFEARGGMRLLGVEVAGSLDLTGAHLTRPDQGLAMDLGDAQIGGSMFVIDDQSGRRPLIIGRIDMGNAKISGQLLIRNATLKPTDEKLGSGYSSMRRSATAISAPGLFVGGDISMEGDCRIRGGIDLAMGSFSTIWIGEGCTFSAGGRRAIDLINAELRSSLFMEPGVTVKGTLHLHRAHIKGDLHLKGTRWSEPEGRTLIAAEAVIVDNTVDLQNMTAEGGRVRFRSATIGSILTARGAWISNPGGEALTLHRAQVRGSMLLGEGFLAEGRVVLNRSTVEGALNCEGGVYTEGIVAMAATVRGGMRLLWDKVPPRVDLTGATTTVLTDDPRRWPADSMLSGFVYDRFSGDWDWRSRRDWLRGMPFDAGPYEQAAKVFRQHGHPGEAEELLMEQRRQARRTAAGGRTPISHVRDLLYGLVVGYGYRPGRTLYLLGALLALVGTLMATPAAQQSLRSTDPRGNVYAVDGRLLTVDDVAAPRDGSATPASRRARPGPCGDGQVRCFDPLFYTVDTVIPLISLGQRATWYPETRTSMGQLVSTLLNLASLLGWLISTVVVLSFARLARPA